MRLSHALRIPQSTIRNPPSAIAFVGAGGKTTALFQLASELPPPVIVTATTHLAIQQTKLADRHISAQTPEDLNCLNEASRTGVTLVTGVIDGDRTRGISNVMLNWLHAYCDRRDLPLLIEADGARQKPLKAPAAHEPPIPEFTRLVVVTAGLSALGKPLNEESVHRPEIFAQSSGLALRETLTAEALARLLSHPQGGLKNIPPAARRVALLNQADTPELQAQAGALAKMLLPSYHSVVIASLQNGQVHAVHEPVAGIVLAAGEARRYGRPKQLLDWHGQPFVRAVTQTALEAGLSPVIVVTGAYAEQVEAAIKDLPVKIVRNKEWQNGQSASIRAGVRDGEGMGEVGAAIFLLADQPQVTPTILRALVERHAQDLPAIIAPLVQGQRANPVLFDRPTFPDLMALAGDVGGRAIFPKYKVACVPWHDESLLMDIDTPEDYAKERPT